MTVSDEFVRESTTQLRALSDGLLAIEQAPEDAAMLDDAFRTAHSLKGNCAMAGLDEASAVAHAVEDVLSAVRTGTVRPKPDLVDAALDGTDTIEALVTAAQRETESDVDHEATIVRLRETLATREEADADAAPVVRAAADSAPTGEDDRPSDLDADVLDALDTAAEYDDLDELLAAIDDGGDIDEIPDLPEAKDLAAASDAPSKPDDDPFASVQAEVADEETADLSRLQAEIEAMSFGEFDEDDDLTIDELVDGSEETLEAAGGFRFGEDREESTDSDEVGEGSDATAVDTADVFGTPFGTDDEPSSSEPASGFDGSGPFSAPEESISAPSTEAAEGGDVGANDLFVSVQAEVADEEAADLSRLQAEIEAMSFGEFDEDDDLTIDELVDGVEIAPSATETDGEEAVMEPLASPSAPTVPTVPKDLTPAIVAAEGSDPTVPAVTLAVPEVPTGLTPAITAATGSVDVPETPTESTESMDVADTTTRIDGTAPADYAAMRWNDLQRHAADRSVFRPGMTRVAVEAALGALDEGSDTETAISAAAHVAAAAADSSEESTTDDTVPTGTESSAHGVPEIPTDLTPAITAVTGSVDVPATPTEPPAVPEFPADLTSAVTPASGDADVPDAPSDELDTDVDDEPELDTAVEDLLAETGFDDLAETAVDDGPAPDADVDALLDTPFEERDTDVEFARDTATEAFERRFGALFGADDAPVTRMVTSLAESSRADLFADPADDRERVARDRVQSITVDVENAEVLLSMVEELTATRFRLEAALGDTRSEETADALSGLQSVTANLRGTVMDLRLMPFETATRDLRRLVRDTARTQDKRVSLAVSGREVGLDRSVIDSIGAPLVHIVRNAVDHGIESPAAREAVGKAPEGSVEVRAERVRDGVVVEIEDDGRGIDVDAVRQRVVDNDLLTTEEASALPAEELFAYVFEPGFSTTEEVTDVSGRGVGMDVVDRVTADLGGSVEVESTPGEGTTVRLRLPITVAVAEVMFVQSGDERYGIPMTAIEEVETPSTLDTDDGEQHVVAVGDSEPTGSDSEPTGSNAEPTASDGSVDSSERLPLVRLAEAFDTPGTHAESGVAVRLRPETRRAALHCDRVVETREVVIRPFEGALGEVPGVSGATLLGDGELVNIIDVATI